MKLSDIVGQDRALSLLRPALEVERLHHALLFAGPEGVGKETTAMALAASLLCESAGGRPVFDACGTCDGCRRVERGVHPDLIVLMPETEALARGRIAREDLAKSASRDLKIEQVRALEAQLSMAPLGPRRMVLLVAADAMNAPAQNAFLKTLEEPPAGTYLVLLADAPDRLLPTLRSRTLAVPFGPIPREVVAARVQKEKGVDAETAALAAALGGGSLGRALAVDPASLADRAKTIERIEALTPGDLRPAMQLAEDLSRGGRDATETEMQSVALFYRDVAAAAEGLGDDALAHRDLAALARAAAVRGTPDALRRRKLAAECSEAVHRFAMPRLAAERLLLGFLFPELP